MRADPGADGVRIDPPAGDDARRMRTTCDPEHVALPVGPAIPTVEMLDLGALGRDAVSTVASAARPLEIVGGTGSPVRPITMAGP